MGMWKVSLRTYMPKLKMRPVDLRALIEAKFGPIDSNAAIQHFDLAVYPRQGQRVLHMMGTCKEGAPQHPMEPCTVDPSTGAIGRDPEGVPLLPYFITLTHGGQTLVPAGAASSGPTPESS